MEWVLLILFLFLSAFFSGSEIAYIAANRLKLELKARRDSESASDLILLDPSSFLTTTLVGNNVVMVACSSVAVLVLTPWVDESLQIIITTAFLLLFGEILPKSIAQQIPNRLMKPVGRLIAVFYYFFIPVIKLSEFISNLLVRLMRGERQGVGRFFRKHDLPILIREYTSPRVWSEQDRDLINRAIRFSEQRVNDVMIHRTEIVAVEQETSWKEVVQVVSRSGLSRIPVFKENIDNIVGFVHALDLLMAHGKPVKELLRPVVFIPESASILKALKKLQRERTSMAIAVDEHGGVAGLVTIEDLIEELFGEIADEYDAQERLSRKSSQTRIQASGRTELSELAEKYQLHFPQGDYVTLAGLIEAKLGAIPKEGDVIEFPPYKIKIKKAGPTRIEQVEIILTQQDEPIHRDTT